MIEHVEAQVLALLLIASIVAMGHLGCGHGPKNVLGRGARFGVTNRLRPVFMRGGSVFPTPSRWWWRGCC